MRAMLRVIFTAAIVAVGSLSTAGPTLADCTMGSPPSHMAGYRGYAFMATVANVTRLTDKAQHFEITFDVERTYAGPSLSRVTVRSVTVNCSTLDPEKLTEGRRVILTTVALAAHRDNTISYVLLWRPIGQGHWRLFEEALHWQTSYPAEVYGDLTTAEVVNVITGLPSTDGAGPVDAGGSEIPPIGLAGALAAAAWLTYRLRAVRSRSRGRRPPGSSPDLELLDGYRIGELSFVSEQDRAG